MIKTINGSQLRSMILSAVKMLELNKEYVNDLNIFPVPDGDTGTNIYLTMFSVAKELSNCNSNQISDLCELISKGALKGARGNSGVILSQIMKGMGQVLAQCPKQIDRKTFAKALNYGKELSYKAVTKPKEGTILSVIRLMSDEALKLLKKNIGFDVFLENIIKAGEEELKQSPEKLEQLKKAGVVDAGGYGLILVFKGFYNVLIGEEDTEIKYDNEININPNEKVVVNFNELAEIEFGYCTELLIINLHKKTTMADIDLFKEKLIQLGDCVIVVGDLNLVKVHVHTNDPGNVLTEALKLGELNNIKIDNLLEQKRQMISSNIKLKKSGIVAVCNGEGLVKLYKDLLVDYILIGGQTMNPSAEDLAKACDSVQAKNVFLLPNNKNILLAAKQAKALSKRNVHIIPTTNIPQGFASVLAYNPDASVQENIKDMKKAFSEVKVGSVTVAVRNAKIDNVSLKKGDIIGMNDNLIISKGQNANQVAQSVINKLVDDNSTNITLYFGKEVTEKDAQEITTELARTYSNCDVNYYFGGQNLYYYIISVE